VAVALAVLGGAAAASTPAFFEPPPLEARRAVQATRAMRAPIVDGVLDDEVWQGAPGAVDFVQREPNQGQPSTHESRVWVAYDDEALYVAAALQQPGGIFAFNQRDLRRDFQSHESDSFSVILDTLGDGRNAFSFSVNPFGAQKDMQVVDDELFELNWDTVWTARTRRDERGWTVELAIPWKSLRYGGPGVPWGVQFYRRERGRNEDTVWSPTPRTVTPWRMAYAGVIRGLEPPEPPVLTLQFRPYVAGRLDVPDDSPMGVAPGLGGEVTWTPTPAVTVDLTANTDFAETDVDRRVVNLSRFSVFFPERRQFFLESAGVFAAGEQGELMPFFSRAIGLDGGRPVPIAGGVRAVYRTPELSAGALVVQTLASGSTAPSLFGLGRYSHNLGEQSRVGGLAVVRHDFAHDGAEAVTNVVPTVDGLFRTGPFTLQATLMGSLTSTPTTAPLAGGAALAEATVQGNWGALSAYASGVTRDFEARAGFVGRGDVLTVGASGHLDFRPRWLPTWLRALQPNVETWALWGATDGRFQERNTTVTPMWLLFSGGDDLWFWVSQEEQVLASAFAPVRGVSFAPGRYSYERVGASFLSQASRKFAFGAMGSAGGYYSARQLEGQLRASVQPLPHVQVSGSYAYNRFEGPGVLGAAAETHLLLVETRLALTPQLQLIGSYQRDTDGNQAILNARLAWEFLPLSFVYVVVTDTRSTGGGADAPPGELRVVAKVTYTWRP
jgi:hypothetical protein